MVKLASESKKQFPIFDAYLDSDFRRVTTDTTVMNAFWKWSAWAEPDYWRRNYYYIFWYGADPEFLVATGSMADDMCTYNDSRTKVMGVKYGLTPGSGKVIVLHGNLVKIFEETLMRIVLGKSEPDDTRIRTLMQATILHEMIHWSYDVVGVDEKQKYNGDDEYGTTRFEQEAYGSRLAMSPDFHKLLCPTRAAAPFLGVSTDPNCRILAVKPGSPADKAGLIPGDLITVFDGTRLNYDSAKYEYAPLLDQKKPGDQVTLQIQRAQPSGSKETLTIRVTLGATTD